MWHLHSTGSLLVYYTMHDRTSIRDSLEERTASAFRVAEPNSREWCSKTECCSWKRIGRERQKTCISTKIITYVIHAAVPVFRLVIITLNVQ